MEYFNHQQHAVQVYLQLDFEAASSSLYLTICPMISLKVMSCYKCDMWILFVISFAKEYPWAEHLTRLLKRGVTTLLSVSVFNTPMSCFSYSIPLKQIIVQIMGLLVALNINRDFSGFKVLTASSTLNNTISPTVCAKLATCTSVYIKQPLLTEGYLYYRRVSY